MRLTIRLFAAAAIALSAVNCATKTVDSSLDLSKIEFIARPAQDYTAVVDDPPKAGSEKEAEDFRELLKWQKNRSKADCELAQRDAEVDEGLQAFGPGHGELSAEQVAALDTFFDKLEEEADAVVAKLKGKFKRQRPYQINKSVRPCIDRSASPSYPSGHATNGRLLSLVLAEIDPAQGEKHLARGLEMGLLRVKGGVHFPSDVAAGGKLAERLFQDLQDNPHFQNAVQRLRLSTKN